MHNIKNLSTFLNSSLFSYIDRENQVEKIKKFRFALHQNLVWIEKLYI